jgi:L-ascorbate metabolism protein UlaG (beta-lactamase superfamily)
MQIQLIRHATLVVTLGDLKLLVDPMLSAAGAMDPVANAANQRRIPLVDLPFSDAALVQLLAQIDGVLVTHTHRDHWDARAAALIAKETPILCQPEDASRIREAGFTRVQPIEQAYEWRGLQITRTGGRHGTGQIGEQMGPVSGFVITGMAIPSLYIAGDTIWCAEVAAALEAHRPDVTVLNAGAAQFLTGDPITMTAGDVVQVCDALASTQVVAAHMDAINHCLLMRADLREHLRIADRLERVRIPQDGETLTIQVVRSA